MSRKILPLVLLTLVLILSGCSTRDEFVVINKSAGNIEVRYQLKRWFEPDYGGSQPPAKLSLTEFQNPDHEFRQLLKEEYQSDKLTHTLIVNLAPDEVLLVDETTNYRGDLDRGNLFSIRITGDNGLIEFEGNQAQTLFRREPDRNYVIRYR